MSMNPVIATLGRRLRLAVIGGGPGSFIGAMHRQAARLDDRYELVAAALSSDPLKSINAGREIGRARSAVMPAAWTCWRPNKAMPKAPRWWPS